MKAQYSAAELAAMRIEGLPGTEGRAFARRKGGWAFIEVAGRGGRNGTRREYPVASLPAAVRSALLARAVTLEGQDHDDRTPELPLSADAVLALITLPGPKRPAAPV